MKFLTSDICIALEVVLLKTPVVCSISHVKLAPGWELIKKNFNPIQEVGPKVGCGHSCETIVLNLCRF